jgi:glycosyltransferase involved in cell wall biosynthesis
MPIAILMPAYDDASARLARLEREGMALEETTLGRTLRSIGDRADSMGGATVFLVDDGSDPPLDPAPLARLAGVRVVFARHPFNLGQGAALETARQLALRAGPFDAYVTMDADGQHHIDDALALARAVVRGADVAFGNRFLGDSNVPPARRMVLHAARIFERALTGLHLADAHNGLRAFSRPALERVMIRQNRMAHATEIKQRISRAGPLVVVEVPVTIRYSRESLAAGQRSLGAVVILRDLLLQYLFGEPE